MSLVASLCGHCSCCLIVRTLLCGPNPAQLTSWCVAVICVFGTQPWLLLFLVAPACSSPAFLISAWPPSSGHMYSAWPVLWGFLCMLYVICWGHLSFCLHSFCTHTFYTLCMYARVCMLSHVGARGQPAGLFSRVGSAAKTKAWWQMPSPAELPCFFPTMPCSETVLRADALVEEEPLCPAANLSEQRSCCWCPCVFWIRPLW